MVYLKNKKIYKHIYENSLYVTLKNKALIELREL